MDAHIARTALYSQWLIIRLSALVMSVMSSSIVAAAPPASNLIELEQVIDRAGPQSSNSDYLKRLLDDPANQELRWVIANPTVITEAAQAISFAVSEQKTKTFHLRTFKNSIDGMAVWIGDIPSDRKTKFPGSHEVDFDPLNNAIIVRDADKLSGSFMVDGEPYKLVFIEKGRHALIKIDEAKLAPEAEPLPGDGEDANVNMTRADDLSVRYIRVLMVTTRQSRANRPTIRADIVNAIEAANLAAANSGVLIRFQLASIYDAAYDETGNSGAILSQLKNVQTDLGKAVADRRNLYLADLVSMVIAAPDTCGMGYVTSSKSTAYSVVTCTTSLAHEMGHNLGATHNWEEGSNVGSPPYMYGYRHEVAPKFRTQMSYACLTGGSCPKIAFFSTPDRSYEGRPMGTVAHHNVARRLNERRGVVDDFYPGYREGYKPFLNRFNLDALRSQCLQTNSVDGSVAMGPCSAAGTDTDQNSMREWKAVPSGTYWNIRNHFKDLRGGQDQCLMTNRTAAGNVMMGSCSPAAGEYSSQRQWTLQPAGNGLYELKNKYSHDARQGECLRTFSSSGTVLLDSCSPSSKADYSSMRRWNWEMFD